MNERWIKWEPVAGLTNKYYLDSFTEDEVGLEIIFNPVNKKEQSVKLYFNYATLIQKRRNNFDLKDLLKKINNYSGWTFFQIENSKFIESGKVNSQIQKDDSLIHLVFLTEDSTVDILTREKPDIILLDQYQDLKENWVKWEPIPNLQKKYDLINISDGREGFQIILSEQDSEKKLKILFDHSVGAYKYTNESFRFNLFGHLSNKYGDDFYANWVFFKIRNSEYLEWLSKNSSTWSWYCKLEHYCIMPSDEIIDIASSYEPEITFIE